MTRPTLRSLIPLALWLLGLVFVLSQTPARADGGLMAAPCHPALAAVQGEGAPAVPVHAHDRSAATVTTAGADCVERCCPAMTGLLALASACAGCSCAADAEAPAVGPAARWATHLQVPETPPPIG